MHTQLIIWFDVNEGEWNVNEGLDSPMPVYTSFDYDDCLEYVRSKVIEINTQFNSGE